MMTKLAYSRVIKLAFGLSIGLSQPAWAFDLDVLDELNLFGSNTNSEYNNFATVNQEGDNNTARLEQIGLKNQATVTQIGNDNIAINRQEGSNNKFIASQTQGDGNTIETSQTGHYNYISANQEGNNNYIKLDQGTEHTDANPSHLNYAKFEQIGDNHSFTATQGGSHNTILSKQVGDGTGREVTINQAGDLNLAVVYQNNSGSLDIDTRTNLKVINIEGQQLFLGLGADAFDLNVNVNGQKLSAFVTSTTGVPLDAVNSASDKLITVTDSIVRPLLGGN